MPTPFDATVIGSGPNGLCAAITLARAGRKVLLREGAATVGGSCRSAALTLPGFTHDVCSTVHALALVSPVMRSIPLARLGVEFVHPPTPFAHPLDGGYAAAERSVDATARTLGDDGDAYRRLMEPLLEAWDKIAPQILGPLKLPRHPIALAKFGLNAIRSARGLAEGRFRGERAQALFAGAAAHATIPLDSLASASFGLVLATTAHAVGWPVVRGGSQRLSNALAAYFTSLGGTIELAAPVSNIDECGTPTVICDVTPRQLLRIAGHQMPDGFKRRLTKYRYGPGVWKVDWALAAPIPWTSNACRRAGTVHVGGALAEVAAAEAAPWQGRCAEKPYVLLVQASLFDPTRAPPGQQSAWAYCHVPNGSTVDMTARIEAQIERFAPGFRQTILARHVMAPADLERHNPNLIGGDIGGGANNFTQLFTRPTASLNPYATPIRGLYLGSASTPPGGGVHGMAGYHAALAALKEESPAAPPRDAPADETLSCG